MNDGSRPSCFTFNPAPCQCAWRAVDDDPRTWAPVTNMGDLDGATDSGIGLCSAPAIVVMWRIYHSLKDSKSIINSNKERKKHIPLCIFKIKKKKNLLQSQKYREALPSIDWFPGHTFTPSPATLSRLKPGTEVTRGGSVHSAGAGSRWARKLWAAVLTALGPACHPHQCHSQHTQTG